MGVNKVDVALGMFLAYCVVMLVLTADLWVQWHRSDVENMKAAICMVWCR